ncbi:uncharacterized protein LOC108623591 isoform X2 [Ceratina calcarata]|uniref:Uncharacterized protein LOC108623591 isoform X2 n=1 Tax=Ceratina calcarata TaxID=156304 RepID=A0AAJ7IVP3_9HYME|nr:uncharacterized protein LOC108623591 isoform X2 [Ceratina calcarata]
MVVVPVAVVVTFFICWAPFHAQRLMAIYVKNSRDKTIQIVYTILMYVSGVFYFLSTTVNPLLYNIMSNKFREAFKSMLSNHCGRKSVPRQPTYSSLSRCPRSTFRQTDDRQNSPSISVSDDNQKLCLTRTTNVSELNGCMERNGHERLSGSRVNRGSREYGRSASRGSNSSQLTTMTTISRGFNEGNNNVAVGHVNECLLKIRRPPRAVTLGLLAERLRQGTKGLFSSQQKNAETKPEVLPPFQSHPSIESANTISNSSLQDYDETEFTGTELARYMGELNNELIT